MEIFNENPGTLYITKRFEESYANELFGEFESAEKSQFEIRTSVMIEKIEGEMGNSQVDGGNPAID